MKIRLFRDGIGFSFWHFYEKPHGTAIQCRRVKPGLFGIRKIKEGQFTHGTDFGFWWTWNVQLVAIHENLFKDK